MKGICYLVLFYGAAAGYAPTADKAPMVAEAPTAAKATAGVPATAKQLVFGSYKNPETAKNLAARLSRLLNANVRVVSFHNEQGVWYRVATQAYAGKVLSILQRVADRHELYYWLLTPQLPNSNSGTVTPGERVPPPPNLH